ncbi:palmitoyltransferase ZDHHC23 isoform X1 [Caretta caretta]|uniref:palmitoyltransferase ZDHHC23 isoform X1 n=1 Tax=Caretta caretta TaxID=8467 RepID=UPI003F4C2D00
MEEPLCCCEYIDRRGEKNHLVACCCDCEDLDEGCERWLTCRSLPPGTLERIADTILDRFRIPWLKGAIKINISLLPPLVLLPVFLHIAALHFLLALVILTSLPVVVLWYYYLTHRRKGRTLFFLSLGLFSLGYMYYVFLREVVPRGHVGQTQVVILTCGLILLLVALSQAKRDPGYLASQMSNDKSPCQGSNDLPNRKILGSSNGLHGAAVSGIASCHAKNSDAKGYSRTLAEGLDRAKEDWCTKCQLIRPPRAGHCRLCGICVRRLDHHCVWINSCVGERNHRAFILVLSLFLLTSIYGITLTLDTICRGQNMFIALFYCPGTYADYRSHNDQHLQPTKRERHKVLQQETGTHKQSCPGPPHQGSISTHTSEKPAFNSAARNSFALWTWSQYPPNPPKAASWIRQAEKGPLLQCVSRITRSSSQRLAKIRRRKKRTRD